MNHSGSRKTTATSVPTTTRKTVEAPRPATQSSPDRVAQPGRRADRVAEERPLRERRPFRRRFAGGPHGALPRRSRSTLRARRRRRFPRQRQAGPAPLDAHSSRRRSPRGGRRSRRSGSCPFSLGGAGGAAPSSSQGMRSRKRYGSRSSDGQSTACARAKIGVVASSSLRTTSSTGSPRYMPFSRIPSLASSISGHVEIDGTRRMCSMPSRKTREFAGFAFGSRKASDSATDLQRRHRAPRLRDDGRALGAERELDEPPRRVLGLRRLRHAVGVRVEDPGRLVEHAAARRCPSRTSRPRGTSATRAGTAAASRGGR